VDPRAISTALCEGFDLFYSHTRPAMETMARLLRENKPAPQVMEWARAQDAKRGRNDACPCGSGRKFTHCHGTATSPRAAAPTAMANA
jgi:uncharacterized protein